MRVREAKDLLVQQAAEQAAIENVPLSDLEKRMMYFTESADAVEDPIKLNEEFDAEYDNAEYEAKISKLLHHAHDRIKKKNPETAGEWDAAMQQLRKGDHYILALWDLPSSERPPYDSLKLLGAGLLVAVALMAIIFGYHAIANRFGFYTRWNSAPKTYHSIAAWFQRSVLALVAAVYVYYVFAPLIIKKPLPGISKLFSWLLCAKPKDGSGH
jgi:hypothetical protein